MDQAVPPTLDELVETIRAIIGPSDTAISRQRIVSLLREAEMDPNKAVDLFFQAQMNGTMAATSSSPPATNEQQQQKEDEVPQPSSTHVKIVEPEVDQSAPTSTTEWSQEAVELSELLGGNVPRETIVALLERTSNNLERAVEIYFAQHDTANDDDDEQDDEEDVVVNHNELFPAAPEIEIQPMANHTLEPLTPPPPAPQVIAAKDVTDHGINTPPSTAELESLLAPGTYEVIMVDSAIRWQIGNVFGRAVVQWVDPTGPAARAGVHKSDVLLSFRDTVVTEHNCSHIVQELSKERIIVPSSMRLRRAPETTQPTPASPPKSPPKRTNVVAQTEDDGDVVMASETATDAAPPSGEVEPKYGLQVLCHAVESMIDAIGDTGVENKVLVDLLLLAEFNLDLAVNNFLNEHRVVSDFRRVVGYDLDVSNVAACLKSEPYTASIPAGPLGLTVENILERTIVVDIKPGGAAERASVKKSSWLVALNGAPITHLTHKETLRLIETAARPLQLVLVPVPQEEYRQLRKQLAMNIRQQKTERPIPEQDRMSFRVFQLKVHQAVLIMPKLIVVALFQHLTSDNYAPLRGEHASDPLEELLPLSAEELDMAIVQEAEALKEEAGGDMCEERRFLLNLFAAIHEYDDKGESIVIRTIQFLGWLAQRYARMQQHVNQAAESQASGVRARRYTLLLSVATHVLESLSIIENHATWDVMVDAFRLLIVAMTDADVDSVIAPMMARLSVSPSPTARIVPIALLSLVYPRVVGDIRVQLRGMLDRMCNDDNPLVRRAIASTIGDLVNAAGAAAAHWGVQLLEKATADTHDIVRIFAVKSCIRLATDLRQILHASPESSKESIDQTLRLLNCQMVPMVNTFTSDSSWQVRLEAAKTLPAFCLSFGSEYADVFVDHFVGLVRDPTVEIRRTCAENVFDMGDALIKLAGKRRAASTVQEVEAVASELEGIEIQAKQDNPTSGVAKDEFVVAAQTKIVRSVLPATYALSTDLSVAVRLGLAKSVGKILQLLGTNSYDDLVPIFTQILDDTQDANVRATLLEEMARHCDHSSETVATMLVTAVKALRTSAQWRVRVKFVHCVAAWADRCDKSAVPPEFSDAILDMLADPVNDVRMSACSTLPILVRSVGSEWLITKGIPKISSCLQATFNGRVTGLTAIEALADQLKELDKLREVIETVVEECTSKTANLRFRALRSLGVLVPLLDEKSTTESTIEFVRPLTDAGTEQDADVRYTAMETLERLEAHLASITVAN